MKISLQWLSDFLSGPIDPRAAADALTHGGLPVESIEPHGSDTILDVEVTSNRSDCLSHLGIARELSALLSRPLINPNSSAPETAQPAASAIAIQINAPDLCPHYTARVIRNVKIGPSPAGMIQRLESVGLRSINNVVDVTNYVMFELGQPLHAFDLAKISGAKIIVRRATAGEKFTAIDGKERPLRTDMLVIADVARPVALAGVMGGLDSEVSNRTVDLLLESARFDPLSIRRTARAALGMKSDSSYRFERGIDPTLPARAALRAAELILKIAGGELQKGLVQAGADGYQPKQLTLRLARLQRILGVEFPPEKIVDAFNRLQFSPRLSQDAIDVLIPSYRLDITTEIDLVEEAARVIGYDAIPMRDEISIRLTPPDPTAVTMDAISQTLVAGGYFEAVTFSFVSDSLRRDFLARPDDLMLRADSTVRKADASLRPSLIPGLLQAVRHNETAGVAAAKLFEAGSIFSADPAGKVHEARALAFVGSADLREVRGVIESILTRLDANRPIIVIPHPRAGFAIAASGRIKWGDESVGFIGIIDRAIADKLSLRHLPAAAELELAPLLAGARHIPKLKELPTFPAIRRDLSLVLSEAVRFEKLEETIRALALPFLENVEYVTTYRGKPLPPGVKSVTTTLVFRSPTTTLTSEQVEPSVQKAITAAKEKIAAELRV